MTRTKCHQQQKPQGRQSGFTLVEVILSLFIFSLIAVSTLYALRIGINTSEQLDRNDRILRQFQIARLIIKEDMAQLSLRSVRDEFGNRLPGAFTGGDAANSGNFDEGLIFVLRFVRTGIANPEFEEPRSNSQYVEYVFRDNDLVRRSRLFLDGAEDQVFLERVLLSNLDGFEIDFLSDFQRGQPQWAQQWPLGTGVFNVNGEGRAQIAPPPQAFRLRIESRRFGSLSQLFWIGRLG